MIECPFKTPVTVIETNGSIVDDESEMILKVLYSHKTFDLQVQQLHYAAKAINSHEKLVEAINLFLNENFSGQSTLSPYAKRQAEQALKEANK